MSKISEIIDEEILRKGVIPFSRFMEVALYCPDYGFYEAEGDTVGRAGHFYTSVSVGSLFGELLASQFAPWLEAIPESLPVQIAEAGAHDGRLARDVLTWFRDFRPDLCERMQYWIFEPSPRRRQWQADRLSEFAPNVVWFDSPRELLAGANGGSTGLRGVLFSNELLDAFPVHRLAWDRSRQHWFEWGVTLNDGALAWSRHPGDFSPGQPSPEELIRPLEIPDELLPYLPDGFVIEVCPGATRWWSEAANALAEGRLLTIDYGLSRDEILIPERTGGTLRGYSRHQVIRDVLADPGTQDISAHVNFSALQAAGERAGLETELYESQGHLLTRIASRIWKAEAEQGEWSLERVRQFKTLIHPGHLGAAFRVLVQRRSQS